MPVLDPKTHENETARTWVVVVDGRRQSPRHALRHMAVKAQPQSHPCTAQPTKPHPAAERQRHGPDQEKDIDAPRSEWAPEAIQVPRAPLWGWKTPLTPLSGALRDSRAALGFDRSVYSLSPTNPERSLVTLQDAGPKTAHALLGRSRSKSWPLVSGDFCETLL
jgi:hypothetical protein